MQNQTLRHCTGCMTRIGDGGQCSNPRCDWDEARQPDSPEHLPLHYLLLDRYYIGRVLGQGGFGVTYIAQDLKLDRVVAIKEYLPKDQCSRRSDRATVQSYSGEKSDEFQYGKQRFLNEAQNVAKLGGHPNIVAITDYAEANGTAYMVMEFISGVTLKQYLASQGGSIPYTVASELMLHVMSGLRRAHEHGLIHRDVSPDNIMISNLGPIKLIDFGAARQAIGEKSQNLTMILKPGYAPEEQYRARGQQGPWTDVYAAGATLYRCITGRVPPAAPDRLSEDDLVRPSTLCRDLPAAAEDSLLKALAVRAAGRFQTMIDFQQALRGKPAIVDTSVPFRNPIQPPVAPVVTATEPPVVLYSAAAVTLATFFGTALGGSIILAINYRRMKNTAGAWKALSVGLALTTALLLWSVFGPSGSAASGAATAIGLGLLAAYRTSAKQLQGKAVEENLARGGKLGSNWAAIGVGLLSLTVAFVIAVLMFIAGDATKSSVTIGSKDKVEYSGSATEQEARSLGEALKTVGYFQNKGFQVDLDRAGGIATVSFVVVADAANDPKMVEAFQTIGRAIAPSVGGLPAKIQMIDSSRAVKYETMLTANSESVPNLK